MIDQDIHPIGVRRVSIEEAEGLIDTGRWQVIDVRKDADIDATGTIPGSIHYEYKFEGATYTGRTQLTKEAIESILAKYEGVIIGCNGVKCPRSFNACVAIAQQWSIPATRVRWLREGVKKWRRSPLVPSTD